MKNDTLLFHENSKESFGRYIFEKRKAANLTQQQMAEKLYVDKSTISKWERGVSYPDISLVQDICNILSISEHELLTASDDYEGREIRRDAYLYRKISKIINYCFSLVYCSVAIICFMCNILFQNKLSWFWIVITSLMLAYSITNVHLIVKTNKLLWSLISSSVSLVLLLFSCWIISDEISVAYSLLIVFIILLLPWALYTYHKHYYITNSNLSSFFILGIITIWSFVLVGICTYISNCMYVKALLVTAIVFLFPWILLAEYIICKKKTLIKTGIMIISFAVLIPITNELLGLVFPTTEHLALSDFVTIRNNNYVNFIVFYSIITLGIILLIIGIIRDYNRKDKI